MLSIKSAKTLQADSESFDTIPNFILEKNNFHIICLCSILTRTEAKHRNLFKFNKNSIEINPSRGICAEAEKLQEVWNNIKKTVQAHKWTSIQEIELDYTICFTVTSHLLMNIGRDLGSEFKNIQSLRLEFNQCNLIRENGLEDLSASIGRNLPRLKSLMLCFSGCLRISDRGLEIMSRQIFSQLSKLKAVTLYFVDCYKITDNGLKHLGCQIGKYQLGLLNLSLRFSSCERVTGDGLVYLVSKLSKMRQLEKLALGFDYCPEIDNASLEKTASEISRNLTKLTHLVLDFRGFELITDEAISLLKEKLHFIPKIELNFREIFLFPQ